MSDVIKSLSFTNKELAEFCGVSTGMIDQIKAGKKKGGRTVQARILQFIDKKIENTKKLKEQFRVS